MYRYPSLRSVVFDARPHGRGQYDIRVAYAPDAKLSIPSHDPWGLLYVLRQKYDSVRLENRFILPERTIAFERDRYRDSVADLLQESLVINKCGVSPFDINRLLEHQGGAVLVQTWYRAVYMGRNSQVIAQDIRQAMCLVD
jgi:hypothetical protein